MFNLIAEISGNNVAAATGVPLGIGLIGFALEAVGRNPEAATKSFPVHYRYGFC